MRRYAEIVRERAILRKLVGASDEFRDGGLEPAGRAVTQILDEAEGKIFRIGERAPKSKAGASRAWTSSLVQLIDRVNEWPRTARRT